MSDGPEFFPLQQGLQAMWDLRMTDITPTSVAYHLAPGGNVSAAYETVRRMVNAGYVELYTVEGNPGRARLGWLRLSPRGLAACRRRGVGATVPSR